MTWHSKSIVLKVLLLLQIYDLNIVLILSTNLKACLLGNLREYTVGVRRGSRSLLVKDPHLFLVLQYLHVLKAISYRSPRERVHLVELSTFWGPGTLCFFLSPADSVGF